MKTITKALAIANTTDNAAVAELFAPGTEPDAKTFFKSIRCLVNTVAKIGKDKLGFNPDTDNLLVHKVARTVDGKTKTEWGFSIGDNLYVTYLSKKLNKAAITKGVDSDEVVFAGPWPKLKEFLKGNSKVDAGAAPKTTETPKVEATATSEESAIEPVVDNSPAEAAVEIETTPVKKVACPKVAKDEQEILDEVEEINGEDCEETPEEEARHGFWVRDNRDKYWDADEAELVGDGVETTF